MNQKKTTLPPKFVLAILALMFGFSACNALGPRKTWPKDIPLSEIAKKTNWQCRFTSKMRVGWTGERINECSREMARISFEYAQISANTYVGGAEFALSPDLHFKSELSRLENANGLSYDVYERKNGDDVTEIILAFRGTEFACLNDWRYGNISSDQRFDAIKAYDNLDRIYDAPISVTGHSLGGSLAMQISLCRDVHYNIAFDTSPRFSRKFCSDYDDSEAVQDNYNLSIADYGEINAILRKFGREITQTYTTLPCLSEGGPIDQHNMHKLAACLTLIAALENSARAEQSVISNTIPPDPEDWSPRDGEQTSVESPTCKNQT